MSILSQTPTVLAAPEGLASLNPDFLSCILITASPRRACHCYFLCDAGNVTIGARSVRAKITPQAMKQAGVDIAWPVAWSKHGDCIEVIGG